MQIVAGQTANGRFAYEAAGAADAPPIVFLHGVGGAARSWRRQLEAFGHDWRAIAWDMPGHGRSAPLDEVSVANLAGALRVFLGELGLRRPVLVGHSIGGMILQQFIADHAEGARALVLAQTSPTFGPPEGEWQQQFLAARLGPLDRGESMARAAPGLVATMLGEAPDPAGVTAAEACIAATDADSYRTAMLALRDFDLRRALPQIGVPTMLLAGTRDPNAPAPMMRKMAHAIPGAYFVELEGCGHLANLERPDQFNAVLKDWLATLG